MILGRLTPEMLASAYAACRVHALPSWYELPGLVSLEAACRNKNVVVTAYGTARDYLGKKPFICEPGDENSVYNAVMAAYYAPPVPGLRETASQYSWKATAQNTLAAYHQCVQGVTEAKARVIAPDWSRAAVWQMPGQTAASSPGNSPLKAPSAEVYQPVSESELLAALDKSEEAALRGDFGAAHGSLAALEQRAPNNSRILRAQGALYVAEGRVQMAYPYL